MSEHNRTTGRLLIVEDNAISRRALEMLLRLRGWQVFSAATVAEGLSLLDEAPDCVLLDLMLPDGEGEQVLMAIRERNLNCRVIVTTGCHEAARKKALLHLNPDAILQKPLDFAQICRACRVIQAPSSSPSSRPSNFVASSGWQRHA
ncbi:response regulator [Singulisphaera sp. PoT]|uniref:response regulator n=1 Tax=Singulisphaera sp. PoT TaxID=3411797 RepID=UPI003BF5F6B7